jgi:hypothetical protein
MPGNSEAAGAGQDRALCRSRASCRERSMKRTLSSFAGRNSMERTGNGETFMPRRPVAKMAVAAG